MRVRLSQSILILILIECLTVGAVPRFVAAAPRDDQGKDKFAFTKVDDAILEQASLADEKLDKDGLVYKDKDLDEYINRIGQSLLPPGPTPEKVQYRFHVTRDPVANAFAFPNGSIYITSGLLALMDNEDQLAGVLGHEITHVTNRHTYLENRSVRKKMLTVNILSMIGAFSPAGAVGSTIYVIAVVSQALLIVSIFGYSREKEQEADVTAVDRMTAAKYDPKEFANSFRLLEEDYEGEQTKLFYSDHPKLDDRIAYVSALAGKNPAPSSGFLDPTLSHKRYRSAIEKVSRHNMALAIEARRFRTAIALSEKLVQFNPDSADNWATLADARSALGPRSAKLTDQEKTSDGKKELRKLSNKLTIIEEERQLASTTEGESTMKANRAVAEDIYKKALSVDPNSAVAHRGLGFLYEKMDRQQEAIAEFRKYLELQPNALDRSRISHRVEALEKHPLNVDKKP